MLLKFPAYISLLAANVAGHIDEAEKQTAIKLAHIKTYTCDPLLTEFYKEADKVFEQNLLQLDNELPKDKEHRDEAIKNELSKIEKIVVKLGHTYTETMHRSMKSFKDHVSRAHRNVLMYFVFPIPLEGITD